MDVVLNPKNSKKKFIRKGNIVETLFFSYTLQEILYFKSEIDSKKKIPELLYQ